LFIQIKIKNSLILSGAETRDNICKKKGKKKIFSIDFYIYSLL